MEGFSPRPVSNSQRQERPEADLSSNSPGQTCAKAASDTYYSGYGLQRWMRKRQREIGMGVSKVRSWVRSMGALYLQHAPTTNRQKSMTEYQPRRGGKISTWPLTILRIVRCSFMRNSLMSDWSKSDRSKSVKNISVKIPMLGLAKMPMEEKCRSSDSHKIFVPELGFAPKYLRNICRARCAATANRYER